MNRHVNLLLYPGGDIFWVILPFFGPHSSPVARPIFISSGGPVCVTSFLSCYSISILFFFAFMTCSLLRRQSLALVLTKIFILLFFGVLLLFLVMILPGFLLLIPLKAGVWSVERCLHLPSSRFFYLLSQYLLLNKSGLTSVFWMKVK